MSRARNRADGDFGDLDITNIGAVSLDSIKGDADGNTSLAFSGSDVITITTGGSTAATFNASQALTLSGNLLIPNAGTIGSAGDTNAISISSGGVVAVTATTANTSATDGALTVAGGVGIAADLSVGDDLRLISDSTVLSFGADSEITLTHVADTGLLLNGTSQLQFNDASQNITAPSATVLDINATDEIELNATLVDINANLDVSGTYTGAGLMTTGGNIVIPDAGTIGSASDTNAIGISSGGVVSVTATTANTSATDGALTVAGGVGIAADLSVGDDLRLISDAAVLSFGADSDVTLTHVHNEGILFNSTNQFRFGDSGTYIHQSADGVLDLVSDNEIELNGTLVDINANVEISGTLAQAGVLTMATDVKLQFRDTGLFLNSSADGQLDIVADTEVQIAATTIDINGNVEISGTTTQTGVSTSTAKDVFNAGMSVKNGSTSAGFVEFFEDSDNGTNKVTVIGPASTADVTVVLPSAAGTLSTTDDATALAIALG